MKARPSVCVVLHHHAPHVSPGDEAPARWLYDTFTDSWLPLLGAARRLADDGLALTLSLSPLVLEMFAQPAHREACADRLRTRADLAEGVEADRLRRAVNQLDGIDADPVAAWRALGERPGVELLTAPATHALLPLMVGDRGGARAQVQVAVQTHERHLGRRPRGLWLAEGGYRRRLDALLAEAGLDHFVAGAAAIAHASSPPALGHLAPLRCPESGLVAFGATPLPTPAPPSMRRDVGAGPAGVARLWQARAYTHPSQLLGSMLPEQVGVDGFRGPYDPVAGERAAGDFARRLAESVRGLGAGRPERAAPVVVCAWPADVFGRWWTDGVPFVEAFCRALSPRLASPAQVVDQGRALQRAWPASSTVAGDFAPWTAAEAGWLHHDLFLAADRMGALAPLALEGEAPKQAARELMLARSSDWALLLSPDTPAAPEAVEWAYARARDHLDAFARLATHLEGDGPLDAEWLADRVARYGVFPELDPKVFVDEPLPRVKPRPPEPAGPPRIH